MAVRENELYIGTENLNIEGRSIKHPSLIRYYASVNANKLGEVPIDTIGVDIETNHLTGELMLLGFYDREYGYSYYTNNFLNTLFMMIKVCDNQEKALAYWNRLDPFVILRELLLTVDTPTADRAMMRFGKENGEWDKENGTWEIEPIFRTQIGDYEFGIKNVIRSSIQFYLIHGDSNKLRTVWAFDIAGLYMSGLEKEAKSRFDWYSKIDESAHKVDWIDFASDSHYRNNIVLESNKLDARAAMELAYHIQDDFYKAFNTYPKSLVSQGSLARTAIVSIIDQGINITEEKRRKKERQNRVKTIGIMNYYDEWANKFGKDFMKDLYCLFTESYSGGYIDAISYGYSQTGWYADIASAYPGIIQHLYDLTNAKWQYGKGKPKRAKKGYTFIRGTVTIPKHINYHPLTVKHPLYKDTNIRPTGTFKASYIIEERDHLQELGATFKDEEWYTVETSGEKSHLANVCKSFIDLRKKLKAKGDSAEYMAKIAANSLYGILFEAVDTHKEFLEDKEIVIDEHRHTDYKDILKKYRHTMNLESIRSDLKYVYGSEHYQTIFYRWHATDGKLAPDEVAQELESQGIHIKSINPVDILEEINDLYTLEVKSINKETVTIKKIRRDGYRAGEFWNPLYASIITAKTRILMSKAANAIEKNGGQPIILMTDSITWKGKKDMLPSDYVKEIKTLGYFETPEQVKDIICLGSGRYGFKLKDKNGEFKKYEAKRRGLNAVAIHDKEGLPIGDFNWDSVLNEMAKADSDKIKVSVRTLISPGVVYLSNKYTLNDLGRIVDQTREVKAVVGNTKREIHPDINDPTKLQKEMIKTESLYLNPGMFGKTEINDQTLPYLRKSLMAKELKTRKEKTKHSWKNASNKYKKNNRVRHIMMYKKLKTAGYSSDDAKKMCQWSDKRFKQENISISL